MKQLQMWVLFHHSLCFEDAKVRNGNVIRVNLMLKQTQGFTGAPILPLLSWINYFGKEFHIQFQALLWKPYPQ